ncbi:MULTISPECIES: extracellular solute-binding protein [unclassified Paenibacillus]|uniref:extracellular solute-binding protein n=1 Tax=unclassified Paenibacillus TaxID=185978 RepID=UPI000957236E|nr:MULTISPECIES: extracellular solute-binding protein [unclassified Paenibacillus]SIQ13758.1 arabinogalactan oligomer / maltooligosaccharide transport system substrate-binding protein [Paenibacillus sp. RU4X]SIQ35582.1 arabinogalactan oligomer / maltooligosaccharide transport system substrate-binding protein [Paenibacillus sp. RU4T]
MKKQKTAAAALAMAIALTGLTACGSNNNAENNAGAANTGAANTGAATEPAANTAANTGAADKAGADAANMPEKPAELTIWPDDNADSVATITDITKKYTEKTGIKVNVKPVKMNDQQQILSLDGPAGKGPDLFYQPGIGNLVLKGLVQPVKAEQAVLDSFTPEALKALSQDGQLYGLPFVTETYALFYNKKLVPAAPATIADLEKLAQEQTDAKKQTYGFLFEGINFYYAWAFMGGNDGYIFKGTDAGGYDVNDIGLNKEGAVKGVQLIQDWFKKGYLPKGVNGDIVGGLFGSGKVGAVINGPWAITDYKKQLGDDLAVAPLPTLENGKHPTSFIGVKGWMLSKFSKSPEWASDLAAFITNQENALEYYKKTGQVPPVTAVLNDTALTSDPLVKGFTEQVQFGQPFPTVPELDYVWDPMKNALQFASEGKDVQKSLDDAVKQVQDKMAMSGK